jgi:hypothetical protein
MDVHGAHDGQRPLANALLFFVFFLFCYDSVNSRSGLLAATVMTVELDCCDLRFCQFTGVASLLDCYDCGAGLWLCDAWSLEL